MYIIEKLIKSFTRDVIDIAESCKVGRSWMRVYVKPVSTGLEVSMYSDNGYTEEEAYKLAQKVEKRWDSYSSVLNKYKGYLEEDKSRRSVSDSGEGEYDTDYGMDISLYYNFGTKITKCDGTQYYIIKKALFDYLMSLTNDRSFIIEDKGDVCSIGKYFEFDYISKMIYITNRVTLTLDESIKLSNFMVDLLTELTNFGVSVKKVSLDYRIPYYKSIYFYSVGKECVLWSDICNSKEYENLFGEKEFD